MKKDFEFAWLVGLLEGEGHFGYHDKTQNVSVRMTDKDTVERVVAVFQLITRQRHHVRMLGQPVQPRKEVYYVQLYGSNARVVMKAVVKYMSQRRRQQIWRALNKYTPPKLKLDAVVSGILEIRP